MIDYPTESPLATWQRPWRVRSVDTDAGGFAHFSSYVKMMEETEYAFLRSRGLSVVLNDEKGILGFPRISADVQVVHPIRFDDEVTVELSLVEMDGKQLVYDFVISMEATSQEETRLVAKGRFVVALCRFPAGQPPYAVLIPDFVQNALM